MRRRSLLVLAVPLLAAASLRAQVPAPDAPSAATAAPAPAGAEATHEALRALKKCVVDAVAAGDVDKLSSLLAREVVVTWQNAEVCRGPAAVKAYYERMMKGPSKVVEQVSVAPEVDTLSILYGSTAIAYGSSTDSFKLTSGLTFTMKSRWSSTLVLEDGAWKIASFHASTNLFDNPLLSAAKRSMWLAGGAGAVIGLLAGFLLFRKKG